MAYIGLGQHQEALQDFNLAISTVSGTLYTGNFEYFAYFYGRGLANFNLGHYERAVDDLTAAIERFGQTDVSYSDVAEAHIIRGISHGQMGEIELTRNDLAFSKNVAQYVEFGLGLNPLISNVYYTRGLAFLHLGQYARSIAYFDKAINLDPKNGSAYFERAVANAFLGRHQLVVQDVNEALKVFEDSFTVVGDSRVAGQALFLQGQAYKNLGQTENAVLSMTRSLDLGLSGDLARQAELVVGKSPEEVRLYPLDYRAYEIQELDSLIQTDSQDDHAYSIRGLTYLNLGQQSRSLLDLDEAIRLNPEEPKHYIVRGDIRSDIGDLKKAIEDYTVALRLRSIGTTLDAEAAINTSTETIATLERLVEPEARNGQRYLDRGLAYMALGQHERAIEDLNQAISIKSGWVYLGLLEFFPYFFSRGLANFNLGRYEEAVNDLTTAIERFNHPDFPEARIIRGISYGQMGQADLAFEDLAPFEKSIEDISRGARLNPQGAQVYYTRGLAFLHLGQYARSIAYFDKAISLDQKGIFSYLGRSLAHANLGQLELSSKDLNQAVTLLLEDRAATGSDQPSFKAMIPYGRAFLDLTQSTSAAKLLEATDTYMSGPLDYSERGLAYYDIGYYAQSIADFDQVIDLEQRNSQAFVNRALAYMALGQHERAIEDLNQAISIKSGWVYLGLLEFFPYFFSRGLANFNLGRYEEAVNDLTTAIERFNHPDFPEARIIRGISYGQMGQADLAFEDLAPFEKSIEDISRGARLNPQGAQVYYTRGLAFLHLGQYARSIAYFDKAISLDQKGIFSYLGRSLAHANLGQLELSSKDLNQAVTLLLEDRAATGSDQPSFKAMIPYGRAFLDLTQSTSAAKLLEATDTYMSGPLDYSERGLAYYDIGYYAQSIADFDQVIDLEQRNSQAFVNRALAYMALGQHERAIEDLNQAISIKSGWFYLGLPEFFPYFFSRGLANFNLGRYEEAVNDLSRAVTGFDHPALSEAFIIRGISYGQLGKVELAGQDLEPLQKEIEDLEQGFKLNPQESNVFYTRGLAFLHLGQYQQAILYFDQAISLDPQDPLAPEALRLAKSHLAGR
jgi:tetratricopeptide (TPR) repeat protein